MVVVMGDRVLQTLSYESREVIRQDIYISVTELMKLIRETGDKIAVPRILTLTRCHAVLLHRVPHRFLNFLLGK
jgi:hypothetical protein